MFFRALWPGHPSTSSIMFGMFAAIPANQMHLGLCKSWFPAFGHFTFHFDVMVGELYSKFIYSNQS